MGKKYLSIQASCLDDNFCLVFGADFKDKNSLPFMFKFEEHSTYLKVHVSPMELMNDLGREAGYQCISSSVDSSDRQKKHTFLMEK